MFLGSVSAISPPPKQWLPSAVPPASGSLPRVSLAAGKPRNYRWKLPAAAAEGGEVALTGVLFHPFEEVKSNEELEVPISPYVSLARQRYAHDCEAAINEQINVEYTVSYVYHSMYAYFDRDNVALKGLAKFFKESSEEERDHAEKLMEYQNVRGGRVKLHSILNPPSEFEHVEKGDALYGIAVLWWCRVSRLQSIKSDPVICIYARSHGSGFVVGEVDKRKAFKPPPVVGAIHKFALQAAERNNDPQMAEFIEREYLGEQVEAIKKIAEYVTQLRMVGKGHGNHTVLASARLLTQESRLEQMNRLLIHPSCRLSVAGVWHFDQMLLHQAVA